MWLPPSSPLDPASARAQVASGRGIPRQSYYAHLESLNAGDYKLALDGFKDELRSGIRTAQSRWIDSICFYTMVGESYYKLGQYGNALDSYTAALNLYLAFPNWMVQVQYPPKVPTGPRQQVAWGRARRNTEVGRFSAMLIQQGQPITEDRLRKGGVITPPQLLSLDVAEIVRCTCLSMKRRAELLGPLARHDQLTGQVLAVLQRRPGVPNHWSQCWIDAQLGFGKLPPAMLARRSLAFNNRWSRAETWIIQPRRSRSWRSAESRSKPASSTKPSGCLKRPLTRRPTATTSKLWKRRFAMPPSSIAYARRRTPLRR